MEQDAELFFRNSSFDTMITKHVRYLYPGELCSNLILMIDGNKKEKRYSQLHIYIT